MLYMAFPALSLNDILLATFDSVQCKAANEDVCDCDGKGSSSYQV